MKHTPGPWRAVQRSFGYPDVEGGPERHLWDIEAEAGEPVAMGTLARENEANARLVAAAPDLLEAAVECLRLMREHDNPYRQTAAADDLEYAIERAQGQTAKSAGRGPSDVSPFNPLSAYGDESELNRVRCVTCSAEMPLGAVGNHVLREHPDTPGAAAVRLARDSTDSGNRTPGESV